MTASAAIGIMCKAPLPGRTKTRLAAIIGAEAAAELSACFLRDVAAAIEAVPAAIGRKGYGVYAPAGTEDELRRLLPPSFDLLLQADAQFSNVLHGAMRTLLWRGHDCTLLINGDRMVLGPASDGGYYLIGLKRAHRHVFMDIPWGTAAVARRTLERAAQIDLEVAMLPEWYDVDDAGTLGWLREELAGRSARFRDGGTAAATRAYFAASQAAA